MDTLIIDVRDSQPSIGWPANARPRPLHRLPSQPATANAAPAPASELGSGTAVTAIDEGAAGK